MMKLLIEEGCDKESAQDKEEIDPNPASAAKSVAAVDQ
jgi:hypothetical protein